MTGMLAVFPGEAVRTGAVLLAAAFGLVVGSFLNVCIWRIPRGASIVFPGSRCPRCSIPIRWHQNIPVLSWLLLRGRCARCGEPISPRYPAVEALNAILWVAVILRFGPTATGLLLLPFTSALIVLFFTDFDLQLLPHAITWPLAGAGLLVAHWNTRLDIAVPGATVSEPGGRVLASAIGAALGYGTFWAVGALWKILRGQEAMGGGDLMLMLGVGAWLGPQGVLLTTFIGSVAGALVAIPLLMIANARRARTEPGAPSSSLMRAEIPFGCFLAPAAWVSAMWGREIVTWYLALSGLPVAG